MLKKTKQIQKFLESKKGIFSLLLAFLLLVYLEKLFFGESLARELLPLDPSEYARSGVNVAPSGVSGQKLAIDLVLRSLGYVKVITVSVGILMITLQGIRLIKAGGNSEEIGKVKTTLTYILVAFIFISMGQELAKIFDMSGGTFLSSPANMVKHIQLFDKQVQVLITFIKYLIGAIATLNLVIAGIRMATEGGSDEVVGKQKTRIFVSIAGLIMIYLGDIAVNKVFYVVDKQAYSGVTGVKPTMSISQGVTQVIGVTNFLVSFLGAISVLMLVYAGLLYAVSGGQEEQTAKAKKILLTTVIGMAVIFGSFALVSTIISANI